MCSLYNYKFWCLLFAVFQSVCITNLNSECPLSFETGGTMGYNCCFFLNFVPLHIESPYNFGGTVPILGVKNPLQRVNGHAVNFFLTYCKLNKCATNIFIFWFNIIFFNLHGKTTQLIKLLLSMNVFQLTPNLCCSLEGLVKFTSTGHNST